MCVCAKINCSFRELLKVLFSVCYSNIMYWHQHITCLCTSFSFYWILVFPISFFLLALGECQQNPPKVNLMMKMTTVSSSTWITFHRSVTLFALEHIMMNFFLFARMLSIASVVVKGWQTKKKCLSLLACAWSNCSQVFSLLLLLFEDCLVCHDPPSARISPSKENLPPPCRSTAGWACAFAKSKFETMHAHGGHTEGWSSECSAWAPALDSAGLWH